MTRYRTVFDSCEASLISTEYSSYDKFLNKLLYEDSDSSESDSEYFDSYYKRQIQDSKELDSDSD